MTKKHFIELADEIRRANAVRVNGEKTFDVLAVDVLADFCARHNPRFNRSRWLGYIAGTNGPSGGEVKPRKKTLPRCALAMGCLCAGHARGLKASAPCDTAE